MKSKGYENLKPITSHERAVELGRKGGLASAKKQKRKREMTEILSIVTAMNTGKGREVDLDNIQRIGDLKGKNVDVMTAIVVKQVLNAMQGDLSSARWVAEMLGQTPEQKKSDDKALEKLDEVLGKIDGSMDE